MQRRQLSEIFDPLESPEVYYGAATDPKNAPKNSKLGRTRTFSWIEPKQKNQLFESFVNTGAHDAELFDESFDQESSPEPERKLRTGLIVPYYDKDHELDEKTKLSPSPPKATTLARRQSLDALYNRPRRFYISNIDQTLDELLRNEDTDHNYQITIEDAGPKVLRLGTANSNGFRQQFVRGTYLLLNLLQELTIAKRFGRKQMILDEQRLRENPMSRMRRLISTQFWPNLTRQITPENVVNMARDTKIVEERIENGKVVKLHESVRIYVPHDREDQYKYYTAIREKDPRLDVQYLPEVIDAAYIKLINKKPGLLSLAAFKDGDLLFNEPYVVPGGRFNELYGWDLYMMALGLLLDATAENQRNLVLARGMLENFVYEIHHYNKILNANRLYYLGRSQPPFLTDMALRIHDKFVELNPDKKEEGVALLKRSVMAAVKEYFTVWVAKPRLDEATGLSCYHPEGQGVPPETEASHFNVVLAPYVEKYKLLQEEFIEQYNLGAISEPKLDEYFLHDRAVRESGHDTLYRLEGKAAHLATVDLNALLYKYEVDIAHILRTHFGGALDTPNGHQTAEAWEERAQVRRDKITHYLWNEEDLMYYDYHVKDQKQTHYELATCFWPLWAGAATEHQADMLVRHSLAKFEEDGGLVSGTLKLRGEISIHRPSRQWDYPYGWAPQQMLAWIGLANYNYTGAARRLAYRWLYMMTRAFVDYNGVVVEKYNVLEGAVPHRVDAEYGNQGADFKGVATEGFGWVNASYVFGLTFLNLQAQRSIDALIPPNVFLANLNESQKDLFT